MTDPEASQWAVREVPPLPLAALSAVRDLVAAVLDDPSGTQGGTANAARLESEQAGTPVRPASRWAAEAALAGLIAAVQRSAHRRASSTHGACLRVPVVRDIGPPACRAEQAEERPSRTRAGAGIPGRGGHRRGSGHFRQRRAAAGLRPPAVLRVPLRSRSGAGPESLATGAQRPRLAHAAALLRHRRLPSRRPPAPFRPLDHPRPPGPPHAASSRKRSPTSACARWQLRACSRTSRHASRCCEPKSRHRKHCGQSAAASHTIAGTAASRPGLASEPCISLSPPKKTSCVQRFRGLFREVPVGYTTRPNASCRSLARAARPESRRPTPAG